MNQAGRQHWGRILAVAMVVAGLIVYLAVTPAENPPPVSKPSTVNVTVMNESSLVLSGLSVAVGENRWEIGPLPPGGSIPFHFFPKTDAEYVITGRFESGDDFTTAIPYTTQGQEDLVTFVEGAVNVRKLKEPHP